MKEKKVQINMNISITEKEKKILEDMSENDDRSIAKQVSFIVRKHIKENSIEKEK